VFTNERLDNIPKLESSYPDMPVFTVTIPGVFKLLSELNGFSINCIGADVSIGINLGTANVPATHCCHQWRPCSLTTYRVAHTAYINYSQFPTVSTSVLGKLETADVPAI